VQRRAPMFCMVRFTSKAMSARASMPSAVNSRVTPSVASNSAYCFGQGVLGFGGGCAGSPRVQVGQLDADGNRPCNSGIRSDGFDRWTRRRR